MKKKKIVCWLRNQEIIARYSHSSVGEDSGLLVQHAVVGRVVTDVFGRS
jgi:hypothetical protein